MYRTKGNNRRPHNLTRDQRTHPTPPPQAHPPTANPAISRPILPTMPADIPAIDEVVHDITTAAERRTEFAMSPEPNLIAAILRLTRTQAAELLHLVRTDDFQDYLSKAVFALIRIVVTQRRRDPTPQAISALAISLDPQMSTEFSLTARRIILWVAEVYTLGNPLTPWQSAEQVVEDSYRRRFITAGTQLTQMGEARAPISDLERTTGRAIRQWRKERTRLAAITHRANNPRQG